MDVYRECGKEMSKNMKLSALLEKLEYECLQGNVETEVSGVVYDSRKIKEGCLFICIVGANFDGHTFAKEAAEKGAAAILVSKAVTDDIPEHVTVIKVKDTRYAMA